MTDIEGSTRLWEQNPSEMADLVPRHESLIKEVVDQFGGRSDKKRGEGDSLFCEFQSASAAVAAALEAQLRLTKEMPRLRVRMAIHTGEAEARDGDFFGPAVNRTARLRALAYGGQVLLSSTTEGVVYNRLPRGAELRDLGEHPLRDMERPERVFQLVHRELQENFGPLRTVDASGNVIDAQDLPAPPRLTVSEPPPPRRHRGERAKVTPAIEDAAISAYRRTSELAEEGRRTRVDADLRRARSRIIAAATEWLIANRQTTQVPNAIRETKKVESWRPVFEPIMAATAAQSKTLAGIAAAIVEYDLPAATDVAVSLKALFETADPAGASMTWVGNAPRLPARLLTDATLARALVLRRWNAFAAIAKPKLTSYRGRRLWVLHPEYTYLDSLGGDALVSGRWVADQLEKNPLSDELGLSDREMSVALADANILLSIVDLAYPEEMSQLGSNTYSWGMTIPGKLAVLQTLVEDPSAVGALAELANEESGQFRQAFPARLAKLRAAMFRAHPMGYWDLTDEQNSLVKEISGQ
jgi:class 3 adenylate cyclase